MENNSKITVRMPSLLTTPLFLVLLVLKLTKNIDWSWWWITAPLWIPAIGMLLMVFILFVLALWAHK